MPLVPTPEGRVEVRAFGSGAPVTVFAHGVGASIDETRPLASGVPGTRLVLHFRGHGRSDVGRTPWSYASLAGQLRAVADHGGATRAVGVSMGAAALLRLLVDTPDRFERAVFFLPAVLAAPRADVGMDRMTRMADLVDAGDVDGLADLLVREQPAGVRELPDLVAWVRAQAARLAGTGVSGALRALPTQVPITSAEEVGRIDLPCLVVGQEGDAVHPVEVARELAALLPRAELVVFDEGAALWTARRRLREVVAGFLAG
ncbi:MAG: alpha/beta fold hydrolase [Motilibacteraceae bacterium]